MPYPEILIKPMREDLTRFGVEETRTPEDLDEVIRNTKGTVMVVVNSVCGCAAGLARPAIGMALQHPVKPDKVVTVFAGGDIAATERARSYFKGYFPSSPSVGILQDGKIDRKSTRLNSSHTVISYAVFCLKKKKKNKTRK